MEQGQIQDLAKTKGVHHGSMYMKQGVWGAAPKTIFLYVQI